MMKGRAPSLVTVMLPSALVALFPGCERQLCLSAVTVGEMIDALDARWPGMRDRLRDSTPRLRCHLNVFVGGERATLETPLAPRDEVIVMTAISGGRHRVILGGALAAGYGRQASLIHVTYAGKKQRWIQFCRLGGSHYAARSCSRAPPRHPPRRAAPQRCGG
jgi:molybdopterin synthase sulfur carrier subunit